MDHHTAIVVAGAAVAVADAAIFTAVNVIMRDGYTALATMVAHGRINMSIVTQMQAENVKRHEFTNMRIYLP